MIDSEHAVFPLFCLKCGLDFESAPVRLPLPYGRSVGGTPAPGFCAEHAAEGAAWHRRMEAVVANVE